MKTTRLVSTLSFAALVFLSLTNDCLAQLPTQPPAEPGKQAPKVNEAKQTGSESSPIPAVQPNQEVVKMEKATFGGGCFWCTEAVFQQLEGVESVKSGYMGGNVKNPTYDDVCSGLTGHAEVIQIEYDPAKVTFDELLLVFWKTHDPTTLNRQGPDIGTQYRSAVFYHNEEQKQLAEFYKEKLLEEKAFRRITTKFEPASELYVAEDYHQNFFNNNPKNRYCQAMINPKLDKLKKVFADKLKKE